MISEELYRELKKITKEEERILNGQTGIERELYMSDDTEGKDANVIDAAKLLDEGKLIQVRPHTRFVHFPRHTHNYIEVIYMFMICIKIFLARILDVSIGTIKSFYVVKEERIISFILSFIEVLIWYYAARAALSLDIDSIFIPISYSLGYATGTYIGTYFSSAYIKGNLTVHITTKRMARGTRLTTNARQIA